MICYSPVSSAAFTRDVRLTGCVCVCVCSYISEETVKLRADTQSRGQVKASKEHFSTTGCGQLPLELASLKRDNIGISVSCNAVKKENMLFLQYGALFT